MRSRTGARSGPARDDAGSSIIEFLAAGLVDYLHLIQIPVVVGRGIRLWDGLGGLHEQYDVESMTMPNGTTHFFFTRRD